MLRINPNNQNIEESQFIEIDGNWENLNKYKK